MKRALNDCRPVSFFDGTGHNGSSTTTRRMRTRTTSLCEEGLLTAISAGAAATEWKSLSDLVCIERKGKRKERRELVRKTGDE